MNLTVLWANLWDQRWNFVFSLLTYTAFFHTGFFYTTVAEYWSVIVLTSGVYFLGKLLQSFLWRRWEELGTKEEDLTADVDADSLVGAGDVEGGEGEDDLWGDGGGEAAAEEDDLWEKCELLKNLLGTGNIEAEQFVEKCDVLRLLKNERGLECLKLLLEGTEVLKFLSGEAVVSAGQQRDAFLFVKTGRFEILPVRGEGIVGNGNGGPFNGSGGAAATAASGGHGSALLGPGDTLVGRRWVFLWVCTTRRQVQVKAR